MGRGKKWRRDEDVELAAAYTAVASAGVKEGPSFWDAVRSRVQSARSVRALRNRWVLMVQEVKAFVECLNRLEAEGASIQDVALERAMSDFRAIKGRDFEFLSCWEIVRKSVEVRRGGDEEVQEGVGETRCVLYTAAAVEANPVEAAAVVSELVPPSRAVIECEAPVQAVAGAVKKESPTVMKAAGSGLKTKGGASATGLDVATTDDNLNFVQQQLVSEMRRKNDLQEDELALKLFSEGHESDESQQFFKLLKRKKLLLLEKEVDELERGQQRQRQRTEYPTGEI
uniref:Myb-like domain-containing protein n=1 Tax=Hyaloperonospora arabidopsidis (strain Emoy2) TaxID=559515 RepID=M4BQH0_HYAAE